MNPKIDPAIIAEAYDSDPEAARAEYGAEFRDDLADYITREAVDAVVCWGRSELPPEPGVTYAAFCDPSGGVNDAMTLRSCPPPRMVQSVFLTRFSKSGPRSIRRLLLPHAPPF